MANPREITAADVHAAYAEIAQKSVNYYNAEGSIQPQLLLVWLGPEPGQLLKTEPAAGPWLEHLANDKGMLRELVRGLLRGPGDRPHLVVQTTLVEIAIYRGTSQNNLKRVQSPLAANEGIMVAVHTPDQTYGAVSQVDAETGYCVVADLNLDVTYAGSLSMAEAPTTRH
jgi:hypothetical protein